MGPCEANVCVSQRHKSLDLLWCVLLDNQSTDSVCANPALVKNIRKAECPLELSTNGGVLLIHQEADVEGFDKVWFDVRAITNILSFAEVKDMNLNLHCDEKSSSWFVVFKPFLSRSDKVRFIRINKHCVHQIFKKLVDFVKLNQLT